VGLPAPIVRLLTKLGDRKPSKEQLMARTVHCRRYSEDLEGLERPPLPGTKGQDIFDNVSKKAWLEWQGHQTMLINEKHLSLMDPEARGYLMGEMEKFLAGEDFDQADGYVPPSE
jgi:Fe-S cluster biosynthesis and repair protein YggX